MDVIYIPLILGFGWAMIGLIQTCRRLGRRHER
jgi:hypothetical protein